MKNILKLILSISESKLNLSTPTKYVSLQELSQLMIWKSRKQTHLGLPGWRLLCPLYPVLGSCVVAELSVLAVWVWWCLWGIPGGSACWAWVVTRLVFSKALSFFQNCVSSNPHTVNTLSTIYHRSLVQCLERGLLVFVQCTFTFRGLVQCLERGLLVSHQGAGSMVVGLERNTMMLQRSLTVPVQPVLTSPVQFLRRNSLELGGILLAFIFQSTRGLLHLTTCNLNPWLQSLAAALSGWCGFRVYLVGAFLPAWPPWSACCCCWLFTRCSSGTWLTPCQGTSMCWFTLVLLVI